MVYGMVRVNAPAASLCGLRSRSLFKIFITKFSICAIVRGGFSGGDEVMGTGTL